MRHKFFDNWILGSADRKSWLNVLAAKSLWLLARSHAHLLALHLDCAILTSNTVTILASGVDVKHNFFLFSFIYIFLNSPITGAANDKIFRPDTCVSYWSNKSLKAESIVFFGAQYIAV